MPAPRAATLTIVRTSAGCASYRLTVANPESFTAPPRVVWSNRVYARPEGHAGARARLAAWATKHGYRMIEAATRKRA